jgi:hypothetical protein
MGAICAVINFPLMNERSSWESGALAYSVTLDGCHVPSFCGVHRVTSSLDAGMAGHMIGHGCWLEPWC